MSQIRAIRGMSDILPGESHLWQRLEGVVAEVLHAYGYQQIRLPLVEQTALFSRAIGAVTDIVEKEMYSFAGRNGESLSLRPEGTAGCVRALSQHGLDNSRQKLWYCGPMFRYERPQKGRQRQFHQVGVEAFGSEGPAVEAELILVGKRLWRALGIDAGVSLQLNSLGQPEARQHYREALTAYLRSVAAELDEDSRRRLDRNPLRVLDSKSPQTQALLAGAPSLSDYLDAESAAHFGGLCSLLDKADVTYQINPRLVRGLDYYNRTVFEWVTDELGAQGTICAGGRYDALVEQLGGKPTPAAGFAMGMERLVLMMQAAAGAPLSPPQADVYFVAVGAAARSRAFGLAELVRDRLPGRVILVPSDDGSFKSQMKKADRSGARLAVILGEDELQRGEVAVKLLRGQTRAQAQQAVSFAGLADLLGVLLESEDS